MTQEEGNKLIADFMGWVHHEDPNYDDHEMKSLKYHSSWDWLMPVVEKIYNTIEVEDVCWVGLPDEENISALTIFATKEMVWKAVIQFIEWYNNQKSKP